VEFDPIQNDARTIRRQRRLGPDAACVLCGISTPAVLRRVRRSLLQRHHVPGDAIDPDLTVLLCLNCHAIESAGQLAREADLDHQRERTLLDVLIAILGESGAFLSRLGARLSEWAERLRAFVGALDSAMPQWRQLPEARP
jgi:hypothetical protein